MAFGLVLVVAGGFLLGGVWSVWRGDPTPVKPGGPARTRSTAQVVFAGILLVAAVIATAAGILRLV